MQHDPYNPPSEISTGAPRVAPTDGTALPTENIIESLRGTRPWMLLMAILGFIGAGLTFLGGFFVVLAAALGGAAAEGDMPPGFLWILGFIYLVAAGWYIFISVVLVRGFSSMGRVIDGGGIAELEEALDAQRFFWKTLGISVIAGIALGIVAIVGLTIAAVSSGLPA